MSTRQGFVVFNSLAWPRRRSGQGPMPQIMSFDHIRQTPIRRASPGPRHGSRSFGQSPRAERDRAGSGARAAAARLVLKPPGPRDGAPAFGAIAQKRASMPAFTVRPGDGTDEIVSGSR